ncbi:MAG: hypothetical protein KIT84_11100 [Labilithrix sp.]|nr:hypothetical protein [Labilithrix sp.]MCW5811555.1 hypothetical protein [Labilithrix sp.]
MRGLYLSLSALVLVTAACSTEVDAEGAAVQDIIAPPAGDGTYRVAVSADPVQAGETSRLTLRVVDPNGRQVKEFDDLHTQPMHFVAVSSDLKSFLHLHPALEANGSLIVDAPITASQPYKLFFEYDPKGPATAQTSTSSLAPEGAAAVAPNLAAGPIFSGNALRYTIADDTRVELQPIPHGMIMPGMAATLKVAIKTLAGAPATDMVDWLGMPGHAIVLSEDSSTFIHAHGMPAGSGGHGGHGGHDMPAAPATGHGGHGGHGTTPPAAGSTASVLDVEVTLPKAGLYKMFMQVKRGDRVITAPFVLRATAM